MKKESAFAFLTSERFYFLILGSAGTVLLDPMFPTQRWFVSLGKFFALLAAGFVTVGTVDRAAKAIGGKK